MKTTHGLGKYLVKASTAGGYGMPQVALQQYAPVGQRRELTGEERANIALGESRWFPQIFQSHGTPAHKLMSSPGKGAVIGALGGAGAGSMLGAMLAGSGEGAAIGGLGGAGLMGLIGYFSRRARNEALKDLMSRLPEGATKRDIRSDPVVQADEQRAHDKQMRRG